MSDNIDLGKLAAGYVDLWQEHLNAVSKDENTDELMATTMALMNSGAATFANAMAQAAQKTQNTDDQELDPQSQHGKSASTSKTTVDADRAAAAAVSSEQSVIDMARLLERVAALEERIAQLEQPNATGRSSKVRSRK